MSIETAQQLINKKLTNAVVAQNSPTNASVIRDCSLVIAFYVGRDGLPAFEVEPTYANVFLTVELQRIAKLLLS